MSFEGYYQHICTDGHYYQRELHDENLCFVCGGEPVWENLVDLTNGSYDDDGHRIDGYIELKVYTESGGQWCECDCGHRHQTPKIYKVPKCQK